jgi:hypothetical protein
LLLVARLFVISAFWYIGFFAYRLFAYRLFVHDCLLFVISAFCHIGFLFYRLIDIGFLTVGFFRSAFDLESLNIDFFEVLTFKRATGLIFSFHDLN